MILDSLENAKRYEPVNPLLRKAFEYLAGFDGSVEEGQYPIDGDDVFAIAYRHTTAPSTEIQFEAHRKYIDLHYIYSGEELMYWAPLLSLTEVSSPYSEDDEAELFKFVPHSASVKVQSGQFAIFFPEDAHIPACMSDKPSEVYKVVVKVRA